MLSSGKFPSIAFFVHTKCTIQNNKRQQQIKTPTVAGNGDK